MIKVDISQVLGFVSDKGIKALEPEVKEAILKLEKGTGAGNDFIGWTDLASKTDKGLLDAIEDTVFRPAASLLASLLPACGRRGRTSEDFGRYR